MNVPNSTRVTLRNQHGAYNGQNDVIHNWKPWIIDGDQFTIDNVGSGKYHIASDFCRDSLQDLLFFDDPIIGVVFAIFDIDEMKYMLRGHTHVFCMKIITEMLTNQTTIQQKLYMAQTYFESAAFLEAEFKLVEKYPSLAPITPSIVFCEAACNRRTDINGVPLDVRHGCGEKKCPGCKQCTLRPSACIECKRTTLTGEKVSPDSCHKFLTKKNSSVRQNHRGQFVHFLPIACILEAEKSWMPSLAWLDTRKLLACTPDDPHAGHACGNSNCLANYGVKVAAAAAPAINGGATLNEADVLPVPIIEHRVSVIAKEGGSNSAW